MSDEQKEKANARSYAKVYMERGKITKQPCVVCGSHESEMHHPDYGKPLFVVWICRACHTQLHLLIIEKMGRLFTKQLKDIENRAQVAEELS